MSNIKVGDLLVGKINNHAMVLILTGTMNIDEQNNSIQTIAIDLNQNKYNLNFETIFRSYFRPGGPFLEYTYNNTNKFYEVFANQKLMDVLNKSKESLITFNEIKALEILINKKPEILKKEDDEINNIL